MLDLIKKYRERNLTAEDFMKLLITMEEEVERLKKIMQEKFKECEWFLTGEEAKGLFRIIKQEVSETYDEMKMTVEGSRDRENAVVIYKATVLDEAFFSLLYFSGISVSELIVLPLDSYDPDANKFSWEKSEGGIFINITINNKKILDLLKRHLKVNKPKKLLFESPEGELLSIEAMESMFSCYCELAQIKNDEKWQCQALSYAGIKNFDIKTQ